MRRRRGVPRQLGACVRRPARAASSAARSPSSRSTAVRERVDVTRGHDGARAEAVDDLAEPTDVVHDRRQPCAERLEERARLVELGPIREDGDRRVRERVGDPRGRRGSRGATPPRAGLARACRSARGIRGSPATSSRAPATRPDPPRRRPSAPCTAGSRRARAPWHRRRVAAARTRTPDAAITRSASGATPASTSGARPRSLWTTTRSKRPNSDATAAAGARCGCGSRSWAVKTEGPRAAQESPVELRRGEPLQVEDVPPTAQQPRHPERVLDRAHREPARVGSRCATRAGRTRRERGSPAARPPAVAEARRDELDLGAGRASDAASAWSYGGVKDGGSARTTCTATA